MLPNRIAVYFVAASALFVALAPVIANLDLTSTVGIVAGLGAITAIVGVWLNGWAKYEERTALEPLHDDQADMPRRNPGA